MDESIWVRKTSSIWTCPRTHRSTILRVWSMLPRIWLRTTQKYEMWNVKNGRAIHGQDLRYSMTEQYNWRKQKSMSTRIQYCAWEGFIQQGMQLSNGNAKWQLFEKRIFFYWALGMDGEPIEFEWTLFPGFTELQILHTIQCDLERSHIKPEKFQLWNHLYVHVQRQPTRKEMKILVLWHPPKFENMLQECVCERILCIHRTQKRRQVVSKVWLKTRGKMGLHCFKKWWNNSKKQDILYSKGQVHWIVGNA